MSARRSSYISRHPEKIALLAVAVVLGAYAILRVAGAREAANVAPLDKAIAGLRERMRTGDPRHRPTAETLPPTTTTPAAPLAPHDKAWGMSYPTRVTVTFVPKPGTAPRRPPALPTVAIRKASAAADGVTIEWSADDVPADRQAIAPQYYVVERRQAGAWTEVARVESATTWRDATVEPRRRYEYRVKAGSADPAWLAESGGSELAPRWSNEADVKAASRFSVHFRSAVPSREDTAGTAYLTIEKHDPEHGRVLISRLHFAGDTIGLWPEREGLEPTGVHSVPLADKPGRGALVDFDTGWRIRRIELYKADIDYIECEPVFDAQARRTGCRQTPRKMPFSTERVVYLDDEGVEGVWDARQPKVTDRRCPEHGGPGPNPAEEAARREKTAVLILQEADRLYAARKWRDARTKYEELQARFADTAAVKARAAEIEARARESSDNKK